MFSEKRKWSNHLRTKIVSPLSKSVIYFPQRHISSFFMSSHHNLTAVQDIQRSFDDKDLLEKDLSWSTQDIELIDADMTSSQTLYVMQRKWRGSCSSVKQMTARGNWIERKAIRILEEAKQAQNHRRKVFIFQRRKRRFVVMLWPLIDVHSFICPDLSMFFVRHVRDVAKISPSKQCPSSKSIKSWVDLVFSSSIFKSNSSPCSNVPQNWITHKTTFEKAIRMTFTT